MFFLVIGKGFGAVWAEFVFGVLAEFSSVEKREATFALPRFFSVGLKWEIHSC